MTPEVLFPLIVIFSAVIIFVLIYAAVTYRPRPKHCDRCGGKLRRGPWQIIGYSPSTGRPAHWRRYVWCETQERQYSTPRPEPMPLWGTGHDPHISDPDDATFKHSHHVFTEGR